MLKQVMLIVIGVLSFLPSSIHAQSMDMHKAMQASPMPNLMMLVMNNREILQLESAQQEALAQWRHHHQAHQKQLTQAVLDSQAQLHDAALSGVTEAQWVKLVEDLADLRQQLIQIKARCVQSIRHILTPAQWQTLMAIYEQRHQQLQKPSGAIEAATFLRVSPFPKYMLVVIMQPQALNLTPQQDKALAQWRLDKMNRWSLLFEEIHTLEREITQKSFAGESKAQLIPLYDRLLATRREMELQSMDCADNMRKVLQPAQWQQVVSIYQSMLQER